MCVISGGKEAKPVTKSRILKHTKLEKYVCSAVDTYRHIKRGGGRGTILATLKKQKRERGEIYILISSVLQPLSGDSRKKNCVSGEK